MKKVTSDPPACTGNVLAMRDTLDILGGKWKLLILHYLTYRDSEINTFKKIERDIEGISSKVLSKELKDLELNKLVIREVQNTKPVSVKYSISEYGKSTETLILQIVNWGKKHRIKMIKENL